MTATLSSPSSVRKPARAALALLIGLAVSGTAMATELLPPAGKSKLLRDRDVTIIIIDENDRRSSSRIEKPRGSKQAPLQPPSSRIIRDDDELTIRVRRDRSASSGTIVRSGPKIIIVDKNSSGCDGGGVCVIRP
jgi:hypothetical protein